MLGDGYTEKPKKNATLLKITVRLARLHEAKLGQTINNIINRMQQV